MHKKSTTGDARSGEAGHHGADRQPAKDDVNKTAGGTPDTGEAATAEEVHKRSREAAKMKRPRSR
jgi:hypothetical protein